MLALLGTAIYLAVMPGIAGGVIPWWMSRWRVEPPLLGFAPFRWIGVALMAAGCGVFLDSFRRLALHGLGTPSPMFPPRRLVITGAYRYVRNPTYLSFLMVVLGEGLYLGNVRVLIYLLLPVVMVVLFVRIDEEPTLRRTFCAEYERYCRHVPRWVPRVTAWRGD